MKLCLLVHIASNPWFTGFCQAKKSRKKVAEDKKFRIMRSAALGNAPAHHCPSPKKYLDIWVKFLTLWDDYMRQYQFTQMMYGIFRTQNNEETP